MYIGMLPVYIYIFNNNNEMELNIFWFFFQKRVLQKRRSSNVAH